MQPPSNGQYPVEMIWLKTLAEDIGRAVIPVRVIPVREPCSHSAVSHSARGRSTEKY